MNTNKSPSYLHQFSWEEWDTQMIVVLYRSDRRFVVKRYLERVLANSTQWRQLTQLLFSNVEPITKAYTMTENEVKLMHQIFSWHMNETLKFPIIGGLDQLLDWEDVLDFIERLQQTSKDNKNNDLTLLHSPSILPTIPIGISSSTLLIKKPIENKKDISTPTKINKRVRPQQIISESTLSSSSNHWVQINNICVPYIIKYQQIRFLPYQVILDCDLLTEQEQSFLIHFTIKADGNDIQTFERTISSSSSIDFTLNNDLLLIDLYHLIFGMSRVVYIKLLPNQRDVNKSYKTVLAQRGGTINIRSHSIPFISLGKFDYILLDSLMTTLQPTTKIISSLRRQAPPAQSHEIDYFRLIQFYQKDDSILLHQQQQQPQLLISTQEIYKYINKDSLINDMTLIQYQQIEYQKMRKKLDTMENKTMKKPTKRAKEI
ncbi:unnamed protein product [Adineta steineri]|uniref:Uncharacterized protein n=1 Tax=Adineta steineri TaxID=433720 RepID=A0A818G9R0_9BILA|nr:unnamed protein product [Adineta steineri]CAF0746068.1 unnamed protein product [Adineta steineri]CAF3488263.1 unnamed protein product [Adineta steineri]CAF3521555.1 unnamed protein product [Adineta steineri]